VFLGKSANPGIYVDVHNKRGTLLRMTMYKSTSPARALLQAPYPRMHTSPDARFRTPPRTPERKCAGRSTGPSPPSKRLKASNDENALSPVNAAFKKQVVKRMRKQTAGKLVFSKVLTGNFDPFDKSQAEFREQTSKKIADHNSKLRAGATSEWTSLSDKQRTDIVAERDKWNKLSPKEQAQILGLYQSKHSSTLKKLRNIR